MPYVTTEAVNILLLEDSEIDAELIMRQLGKIEQPVKIHRAAVRPEFEQLLASRQFDLILSDYSLPDFDGADALRIARSYDANVPFVFVSGVLGEEFATEALHGGATDYITKKNLPRIPMAASRALVEAAARRERRKAIEALRESEQRFRAVANAAPALIWEVDDKGDITFANGRFFTEFGIPPQRMVEEGWRCFVHEDDWRQFGKERERLFLERRPFSANMRVRTGAGAVRWIRCESRPRWDSQKAFLGYVGCAVDITNSKLARDALEVEIVNRTQELREKDEALRQSQKMEAIGQLTGGIAHDFNNMLAGIIGSADLLKKRLAEGRYEECNRYVDAVLNSANRAASLTQRLLAFSRRQTLDLQPISIEAQLRSLSELVQRTIGPSVSLSVELEPDLWCALTDANQFESAILNLAINSRDAMPEGGKLILKAENVAVGAKEAADKELHPGNYVRVSIEDTGTGMDAETLSKAVDPFFTTKPLGQGTGLGLSMVFGFATQSGGGLEICSEPGLGTTVSMLLPRSDADAAHDGEQVRAVRDGKPSLSPQGSCICVVEDELIVRMLIVDHLEELGYHVVEADNASQALEMLSKGRPVDLLITDVGLPGMDGRQLASEARKLSPDLPILFATGYADGAVNRSDLVGRGMDMVGKPFDIDDLAEKIGALLEIRSS